MRILINHLMTDKEKISSYIEPRSLRPLVCIFAILVISGLLGWASYYRYQQAHQNLQFAKQSLQQLKIINKQLQKQVVRVIKVNQAFKQIDDQGEDLASLKIKFSDQLQNLAERYPLDDLRWQYDVVQRGGQDDFKESQFYSSYFLPVRIQFEIKTEQTWLDVIDALYILSPYYQFHNCQLKANRANSQQGNLVLKKLQVDCQLKLAFYQIKTKPINANVSKPLGLGRI